MYAGYAELGGTQIINNAMAATSAQAHGIDVRCGSCDGFNRSVDDAPYTGHPDLDNAPWYDPSRPESARFLGVIGLGVSGFTSATVERTPVALVGDGSALGALRRPAREIVYTVMLVALDDIGMAYGYEFMAAVLKGGACAGGDCQGDELCMFRVCPDPLNRDNLADTALRHLYNVGILDGITETDRNYVSAGQCDQAASCCTGTTKGVLSSATFTLVAGIPFIYREPINVGAGDWVPLDEGPITTLAAAVPVCPTAAACPPADSLCPEPALPPAVAVPANPCWTPSAGLQYYEQWLSASPLTLPAWGESVPLIEIQAGSVDLRYLVLRFFGNPAGLDCAVAGVDPCAACTDVGVLFTPATADLTLDGRVQRAYIDCGEGFGATQGQPVLYGASGGAFTWPVFDCPSGLCVQILTPVNYATDAVARIRMVPRADAQ